MRAIYQTPSSLSPPLPPERAGVRAISSKLPSPLREGRQSESPSPLRGGPTIQTPSPLWGGPGGGSSSCLSLPIKPSRHHRLQQPHQNRIQLHRPKTQRLPIQTNDARTPRPHHPHLRTVIQTHLATGEPATRPRSPDPHAPRHPPSTAAEESHSSITSHCAPNPGYTETHSQRRDCKAPYPLRQTTSRIVLRFTPHSS